MEKKTIIELLIDRAIMQPHQIAYRFINTTCVDTITNQELLFKLIAVSKQILQHSKPGDRVLLVYSPGMDYIVGFFACLLSNTIAVPVYPPFNNDLLEKLQYIIKDCLPTLALSSINIVESSKPLQSIKTINQSNGTNNNDKQTNTQLCFNHLSWLITDDIEPVISYSDDEFVLPTPTDLAFFQYTSGSTGNPKGVMVSHANITSNAQIISNASKLTNEDIFANWLPPYHDMGLIGVILTPMYKGCTSILMPPFDFIKKPIRWLEMISSFKATVSGGPNFAYALCCEKITDKQLANIDLSHWRVAFCGAEPINLKNINQFTKRFTSVGFNSSKFFPCYGLAEATLMVSGGFLNDTQKSTSNSYVNCGKLHQNTIIVDPDTQQIMPEGEVGEIWVRGASVTMGYWNKPTLNKQIFKAKDNAGNQYLRSGDLGYINKNQLYPVGRLKDLIIINGLNYFSNDIEKTIYDCTDKIKSGHCVAFSIPAKSTEQLIVVAQIRQNMLEKDQKNVIQAIYSGILKDWHIEAYDILLSKEKFLKKTTSGKPQRFIVKEKYKNGELRQTISYRRLLKNKRSLNETLEPTEEENKRDNSSLIQKITQCALLTLDNIHSIPPHQPLSELGLTSIKAIELTAILEKEFNQTIEPSVLYNYASIEQLATYLSITEHAESAQNILHENTDSDDIAVIGMSCQFPGDVNTPEAFWAFLEKKENGVIDVPENRWNAAAYYSSEEDNSGKISTMKGGFIKSIDKFDELFFNITAKEAKYIDPQQRLSLQKVWHALEDAGIPPDSLRTHNVGVFIGASTVDYASLILKSNHNHEDISHYIPSGNSLSAIAGRISYFYGFQGPSMVIDTACSSSLCAIAQATRSIHNNESSIAIAGGVNLIIQPIVSIALSRAGMLSPEGACKAFSDDADGYVRGEGAGFVVLKKLSEAIKDGNPIYATIKGSSINQDGTSNGLTAPNGLAQQALIYKSIQKAGISAMDIDYIEAHGTGTKLGDPIEASALKAVFGKGRTYHNPLIIGAVKSNLGHLESAAGIAGFIKTVLILKKRFIPANLHFHNLNPYIDITDFPVIFPQDMLEWKKQTGVRFAGVSSFGFTGTNVHITLSEHHSVANTNRSKTLPAALLLISANDEKALLQLKNSYIEQLKNPTTDLQDICISASVKRQHMPYRSAVIALNKKDMIRQLSKSNNDSCTLKKNTKKLAFLFTGQGSQYASMAKQLYNTSSIFHDYLDCYDNLIKSHVGISVSEKLFNNEKDVLDLPRYFQPLFFAIELALAKTWEAWGIVPDFVTGHSLGIYAAACFNKMISVEEAIELVCYRGQILDEASFEGEMVAVMAPLMLVNHLIVEHALEKIDIAAINSPNQTIVSGDISEINQFISIAQKANMATKRLTIKQGYHSSMMDPVLDIFNQKAMELTYHTGRFPFVEDSSGKIINNITAEYLTKQIRNPINFLAVSKTLISNKCRFFIEIGPNPVLSSLVSSIGNSQCVYLPSLKQNKDDWPHIISVLQTLFLSGHKINWHNVYKGFNVSSAHLPCYPFTRNTHWIEQRHIHASQQPVKRSEIRSVKHIQHEEKKMKSKENIDWLSYPVEKRDLFLQSLIKDEIRYTSGIPVKKSIHINDDFFQLGIDSLMIVQLINSLNNKLKPANLKIKIEQIKKPCISSVLEAINEQIEKLSAL